MSTSLQKIDSDSTALLSRLPFTLVSVAARCRVDGLIQTIKGAAVWREALLKGKMPNKSDAWPSGPIGQAIWNSFPKDLLRFTGNNKEITDPVVENILQIADGLRSDWDDKVADELEEWLKAEELNRIELVKSEEQHNTKKDHTSEPKKISPKPISSKEKKDKSDRIRSSLESDLGNWAKKRMNEAWGDRLNNWNSISEVFDGLQGSSSFGWDLSKAVLKYSGWDKVLKMNNLLKSLPQIAEIAKALGRAKTSDKEVGPEERIMTKVSRAREELLWVEAPNSRTHTDGIHKSDDIPRMLPMEGSLYLHPIFRKLWKAKYIEKSLACYQIKGMERRRFYSTELVDEEQVVRKNLERGPIIVCLDTSGSMQGVPETVAKAITLEAMRLASAEKRECFLYAFSGPSDVTEHELDLSPKGIEGLCDFLCMSFHGGTDISAPICSATKKLENAKWSRADIILVSDGEFHVPQEISLILDVAKKEHGLRVHGLLVSNGHYGAASMHQICNPLHIFKEWTEIRGL